MDGLGDKLLIFSYCLLAFMLFLIVLISVTFGSPVG